MFKTGMLKLIVVQARRPSRCTSVSCHVCFHCEHTHAAAPCVASRLDRIGDSRSGNSRTPETSPSGSEWVVARGGLVEGAASLGAGGSGVADERDEHVERELGGAGGEAS